MSAPASAKAPGPQPWAVRVAAQADLAGLRTLEGGQVPAWSASDSVWVALPRGRQDGPPLASLRLRRRIGHPVPQAWFRLGWAVHASAELGLYRRQRTLMLGHDLCGADELGGWALAPELAPADAGAAWAALVGAALAAQHAPCEPALADTGPCGSEAQRPCIATLPGWRDGAGASPVWQGLGRHFVPPAVQAATDPVAELAPLMPRQLLYAALLPEAAQAALGRCALQAEPLREVLLAAGFGWREHVGIVDGAPVLERWPSGR